MLYKKYYKFPLRLKYGIKVLTDDYNMAFDFAHTWLFRNAYNVSEESQHDIVALLNGKDGRILNNVTFSYGGDALINANGFPFIVIRSWGRLTGVGALNLPAEQAQIIQDDFAMFIVNRLNEATNMLQTIVLNKQNTI